MSNISLTTLGGVRENGKNMYIAEIGESIFVLNVGLKYPENEQLGVDVVIPKMDYLFENSDRIAGVFLTHGHADAIGALPYLLAEAKVPVFGSELTIELAKLFVKGNDAVKEFNDFHVIDENTEIDLYWQQWKKRVAQYNQQPGIAGSREQGAGSRGNQLSMNNEQLIIDN